MMSLYNTSPDADDEDGGTQTPCCEFLAEELYKVCCSMLFWVLFVLAMLWSGILHFVVDAHDGIIPGQVISNTTGEVSCNGHSSRTVP